MASHTKNELGFGYLRIGDNIIPLYKNGIFIRSSLLVSNSLLLGFTNPAYFLSFNFWQVWDGEAAPMLTLEWQLC